MVPGTENFTVSHLFNATDGLWNSALIEQLFSPEDRNRILGLIVQYRDNFDQLLWSNSRDGIFSVKSGYYVAMNLLIDSLDARVVRD